MLLPGDGVEQQKWGRLRTFPCEITAGKEREALEVAKEWKDRVRGGRPQQRVSAQRPTPFTRQCGSLTP